MVNPAAQQILNNSEDATYASYGTSTQNVPATMQGNIYITNINEYTTIRVSSPGQPAGNTTEVQFNMNGQMDGDDGLTYNPTTDSLTVLGNLTANILLTDNLYYSNGNPWTFDSSYSNTNVGAYLSSYSGNITATKITSSLFVGSGANLTNVPAGNITGTVANASHAIVADSANSVAGADVTGTVSLATAATTAATVTTAAQPNITSIGSLTGLTVSNSTGVVNFTTTANVTLGDVGNLHITGGTSGQVLSTNGSGVLSWATPSAGNLQSVTASGNTTDQALYISNTTDSVSYSTGALRIEGGVAIKGNTHLLGHISSESTVFAGHYADFGSWQNPVFVGRDAGAEYIQSAMVNTDADGSADFVAYGDSSTTDTGWADMGFTGTTFSDANYTITKASDGYVFVQGLGVSEGGPQGGNLVLATGGDGANNDIVFALGSFYANAEFARMDDDSNTFYVGGHAYGPTVDNPTPRTVNLDVKGNVSVGGNISKAEGMLKASTANSYLLLGDTVGGASELVGGGNVWIYASSAQYNFSTTGTLQTQSPFTLESTGNINYTVLGSPNKTWTLDTNGNLTVPGNILPSSNIAYDLGSPTARFKDLYLSGTTIYLGGTLIQAQANGEVTIGNATFSSSGTISAADVSIGIVELTANTVASLGHIGSMLTYSNVGHGITYDIPNNATTSFAIGSRIELLALSQSSITVEPATGSGVTLITSKDLNTNDPTLSNIQSAKLTKIGTDTWYLGL